MRNKLFVCTVREFEKQHRFIEARSGASLPGVNKPAVRITLDHPQEEDEPDALLWMAADVYVKYKEEYEERKRGAELMRKAEELVAASSSHVDASGSEIAEFGAMHKSTDKYESVVKAFYEFSGAPPEIKTKTRVWLFTCRLDGKSVK
jgi:hypothetical protein